MEENQPGTHIEMLYVRQYTFWGLCDIEVRPTLSNATHILCLRELNHLNVRILNLSTGKYHKVVETEGKP
jgi:hypothetical protein